AVALSYPGDWRTVPSGFRQGLVATPMSARTPSHSPRVATADTTASGGRQTIVFLLLPSYLTHRAHADRRSRIVGANRVRITGAPGARRRSRTLLSRALGPSGIVTT